MNNDRITIGRDPRSDVRIDEQWDMVSNNHCDITRRGNELIFIDHSSNGTVINGQKIHNTSVGINPGDKIVLANMFELQWNVINRYFPNQQRPTVTKNIRGGEQDPIGRKTIHLGPNPANNGRKTEPIGTGHPNPEFIPDNQNHGNAANSNYGQANEYSQSEIDKELERWNFGAFLGSWLWAPFNGIYWPLGVLVAMIVPYLGQVCGLCLCVYLGLNGSKMAWRTGKYKDFGDFKRAQRLWTYIGIAVFALTIVAHICLLKYTLSLF